MASVADRATPPILVPAEPVFAGGPAGKVLGAGAITAPVFGVTAVFLLLLLPSLTGAFGSIFPKKTSFRQVK